MSDQFPPEFDPAFYLARYPELYLLTPERLQAHYNDVGRREGRVATPAMPRPNFIKLIPNHLSALEIGPGHAPLLRGANVKYFDVIDAGKLRQRAIDTNGNPNDVPEHIHFCSPTSDMSVIDQKFDVVVSSHVIEHQPDLVTHLKEIERVLVDGGAYYILCPNRALIFDAYLPDSDICDVLEAYYQQRKVHTLRTLLKYFALTRYINSLEQWLHVPPKPPLEAHRIRHALDTWRASEGAYIDAHAWQFTPDTFREIINMLGELELIGLQPTRVYDTVFGWGEFAAILTKTPRA